MIKKQIAFLSLYFIIMEFLFANDNNYCLYPIKKKLNEPSVKYEVGFIDYEGNLVIPFEYSWGTTFEGGVAAVEKNDKYYIINIRQEIIAEFSYPYSLRNGFSDGLCIIANALNRYGYIDIQGNVVIPIEYEYVDDFFNGIAKVKKDKKEFYINKKGQTVDYNLSQKDEYYIFSNTTNELFGLKDKNDNILIPAKYKYLSLPNKCGLCQFTNMDDEPWYGIISINNEIIYPDGTFAELNEFKQGMAIFSPRNNYGGYLREDGKVFRFQDYF